MKNKPLRRIGIVFCILLLILTGCRSTPKEIDGEKMFNALLQQIHYATPMKDVGAIAEMYFSDLPAGTEVKLYTATGYHADEAGMLILSDTSHADAVMTAVKKHIEEMRDQFAGYAPQELGKIDHAVIIQRGKYIFLCITDDYQAAADLLSGDAANLEAPTNSTGNNTTAGSTTGTDHTDPTEPSSDPTVPSTDPTEPSTDPTEPSTDPTEPGTDPTEPSTDPTEPSTDPTEPGTDIEPENPSKYPQILSKTGTYTTYPNSSLIKVDDRAFEPYGYSNTTATQYTDLINRVAGALAGKTTVYNLAIPTGIGIVLPDDIAAKLPYYTNQGAAIEKIFAKLSQHVVPVNCFDNLMQHRDEYLYFRSDHHWNGRGAYYAYEAFCETKGIAPYTLEQRTEKQFPGFLGYFYSNGTGNDPDFKNNPDTVYAYCPVSKKATMQYTDTKGNTYKWNIITDVSRWKASSKYSTFAGADQPFAVFTNPEVTDGSVCIVVKESYGNALLPYLVDHYSTIYEIDYRYWTGNLIEFAQTMEADDLIFANNLTMIGSRYLIGKLAGIIGG